jgi:hypothetical protein
VTLKARRSPLLLLLLVVPLGVITPRWWWWRWDRRTDAPLRAVGLGAGLLGPTCSPLTLLGGSEMSDSSARRSLRRLSSSDPAELPGAKALLAAPLPLSKGLGAMARLALGAALAGWGPPAGASEIRIPRRGSWVIAECRDVLGEYQGLRDKSFPSNPSHQDCQLVPG